MRKLNGIALMGLAFCTSQDAFAAEKQGAEWTFKRPLLARHSG
jgi:hypothetical protein